MLHHEHNHCKPEPPKREQPSYCGKVNTAGMGEYYSAHACPPPCYPHPGYNIPPVKPLFVPGMSTQEQIAVLAGKVDEMCNLLGEYDEKVWGAYDAIVHSCICNDAYYAEIETEVGYLPATSARYTVVHIPFVDKGNQPIRLQLGLAYNNTTNSGIHESVFDASERVLADKLFPACNIGDNWIGKVYWKGAPINQADTDGFTLGVLKNGFLKIYNQTATNADMNKDDVENAMGVAGVLVSGGKKTPDNYGYTDGTTGMVGIGMNYDTQERFFILVDGEQATGVTSGGGCTADQLAELFTKYGCTVAVLLAYKESTVGLDCGEMLNIPYDVNHIPYVPQLNAFWYITKEEHYHNDYVREVAELMQKYGRSIWTGIVNGKSLDAVRAELANVESDLAQEVQDRKDGDAALDGKITALGERVTNLYDELVAADADLSQRITQEVADRQKAVADEAKARADADKALEESGNATSTKLTQEIVDRKAEDAKIQEQLTQEIADRKTADSVLDADIQKEAKDRNDADGLILQTVTTLAGNLEKAINEEKTARADGDSALQTALDKLKSDYTAFKTSTNSDLETKTQQITQILADISSVKNLIAGVQATQSEIDETLTSIQNTLATMEKSFENLKQTVADLQTSWETYKEQMSEQYTQFTDTVEKALTDMETRLRKEFIPFTGNTAVNPITGSLFFDGKHTITQLPTPVGDTWAANKKYVDDGDANNIPLTGTSEGSPVTGEIDVRLLSTAINGLKVRTVTGNYETDVKPGTITLQGEVQGNPVVLSPVQGSSLTPTALRVYDEQRDKIAYVECADPTENQHAATKKYVDGKKSEYDEEYYGLTPTAPMSEAWICKEGGANNGVVIENSGYNTLKFRDEANTENPVLLKNIAQPVDDTDAVPKFYSDKNYPRDGSKSMDKLTFPNSIWKEGDVNGESRLSYLFTSLSNRGILIGDYTTRGFAIFPSDRGLEISEIDKNGVVYNKRDRWLATQFLGVNELHTVDNRANEIIKLQSVNSDGELIRGGIQGLLCGNSFNINAGWGKDNLSFIFHSSLNSGLTLLKNINTPKVDTDAANKQYVDNAVHYVSGLQTFNTSITNIEGGKTVKLGSLPVVNTAIGKVINAMGKFTGNEVADDLILNVTIKQLDDNTQTAFTAYFYLTNVSDTTKSWNSLPIELTYLIDTALTA